MAALAPGEQQEIPALSALGETRRIPVLYVDTTRFFGPLMQVHGRVMRHLDPERYDIYLLADPQSGSAQSLRDLPRLGLWLHPLASSSDEPGRSWRRLRSLADHARVLAGLPRVGWKAWRQQVAVLHVGMTTRMLFVGLFLSIASGSRLVVHAHEAPRPNNALKRLLFKVSMARTDAVIAVSAFIKGKLAAAGVKEGKIVVVLNTVDLDRFNPQVSGQRIRSEYGIAPEDILVVCLGRFFPGKGQLYLTRAMGLVHRQAPKVKCLLIGWDDPTHSPGGHSYKEECRQYSREYDLGDTVIIDAPRPDAPEIMAAADIVAVPSTDDPCPLTVLEAMASGKPVVGFRSGGIPEEVGVGEGGILVEPGDVMGLAQAILDLAWDPTNRQHLGRRARQRAERLFYERRLAEDVMRVYERLVREGPARPRVESGRRSGRL